MTNVVKPATNPDMRSVAEPVMSGMQVTSWSTALGGTTLVASKIGRTLTAGTLGNNLQMINYGLQVITHGVNAPALMHNLFHYSSRGLTNAIASGMASGGDVLTSSAAALFFETSSPFNRIDPIRSPVLSQSDTSDAGAGGLNFLRHLISFWRSQVAKADAQFSSIVNDAAPDESENESFRQELAQFLDKYGNAGMQVVLNRLLRDGISAEIRHMFLLEIARIDDDSTIRERRSLLKRAMRSTDASVRYSAAVALGSMPNDAIARSALSDQRLREKNPAVRKMIQAQLA